MCHSNDLPKKWLKSETELREWAYVGIGPLKSPRTVHRRDGRGMWNVFVGGKSVLTMFMDNGTSTLYLLGVDGPKDVLTR